MADELNFQLPPQGFDSYTVGILPFDQGILAGAFSTSMQQIRNIQSVDLQQFAQVAFSMENLAGLPFTAGTDVPTDLTLATFAKSQTGLGSGVYGTFTNSNFFGCMSGLPYPLKAIYDGIKQLETEKLKIIYQQLYLAVTAQNGSGQNVPSSSDFYIDISTTTTAVENPPSSGNYDYYYQITDASWNGAIGGGYGRAGAAGQFSAILGVGGAVVQLTVNTNPNDVPGTYGKIVSATLLAAGGPTYYDSGTDPTPPPAPTSLPVFTPAPPQIYYPYPYTGGNNTGAPINFTTLNATIMSLIEDANNEILAIKTASASNFRAANILDTNWNITGTALKQEQRARYNFAPPVPIPYDRWLTVAPVALYVFVDSIPDLSKKTLPHMAAQTLEHISNLRNVGGQSVVGMMRQERNQERLSRIGIELDNNIDDTLDPQQTQVLITNGTLCGAVEGVPSESGCIYTLPAWPSVELVSGNPCDEDELVKQVVTTKPVAVFDVNLQVLREVTQTAEGNTSAMLDNACAGPFGNGLGPMPIGLLELPPGLPPVESVCGPPAPPALQPCVSDDGQIPLVIVNPEVPIGDLPISDYPTSGIPASGLPIGVDGIPVGPPTLIPGGIIPEGTLPEDISGIGPGPTGDGGGGPGTGVPIAGINLQPPVSILPPNLNTAYTGTTLIPSTYNVPEAIDKVIECNCDCWIG